MCKESLLLSFAFCFIFCFLLLCLKGLYCNLETTSLSLACNSVSFFHSKSEVITLMSVKLYQCENSEYKNLLLLYQVFIGSAWSVLWHQNGWYRYKDAIAAEIWLYG